MKKTIIIACLALSCGNGPAWAGPYAGDEPLTYLLMDSNARAVGMGGAYTALAIDANALHYNPAGLGFLRSHELSFMHNQYFQDVTQEYAAVALRPGVGLDVNYLRYGTIYRTTIAERDKTLGTFENSNLALGLGYGYALHESLSLGAGVKYLRGHLDAVTAHGYAFDLGALYYPPILSGLSAAVAVQNLGPRIKHQTTPEKLPVTLRGGVAYEFPLGGHDHTISADVVKERYKDTVLGVGAETVVARTLPVRLGFNTRNSAGVGITGGIGWIHKDLRFDYAIMPYGELGFTHRFTGTIRWGQDHGRSRSRGGTPGASRRQTPETSADLAARLAVAKRLSDSGFLGQAAGELRIIDELLSEGDALRVSYFAELGRLAYLREDIPAAKRAFSEALRVAKVFRIRGPEVADASAGMGLCLVRAGNAPYAEKFFLQGLEFSPSPKTRALLEGELKKIQGAPK